MKKLKLGPRPFVQLQRPVNPAPIGPLRVSSNSNLKEGDIHKTEMQALDQFAELSWEIDDPHNTNISNVVTKRPVLSAIAFEILERCLRGGGRQTHSDLLLDHEVAARLRMSSRAVRSLRLDGKIAYLPGRPPRIKESDVRAYIEARRIPARIDPGPKSQLIIEAEIRERVAEHRRRRDRRAAAKGQR